MNAEKIVIQKADPRSLDDLVLLLRQLFSIEADFRFNREKQEKGLREIMDSPDSHLLAAFHGKRAVGMCTLQVLISTARGGKVGLVEDMVVLEEYRKRGIGKMLLRGIEELAESRGLSRLQLLADKNNLPALDFYEKAGWDSTELICLRKKESPVR
jgi:ribosomal protein S18 acetylase RimI-like enzyme